MTCSFYSKLDPSSNLTLHTSHPLSTTHTNFECHFEAKNDQRKHVEGEQESKGRREVGQPDGLQTRVFPLVPRGSVRPEEPDLDPHGHHAAEVTLDVLGPGPVPWHLDPAGTGPDPTLADPEAFGAPGDDGAGGVRGYIERIKLESHE